MKNTRASAPYRMPLSTTVPSGRSGDSVGAGAAVGVGGGVAADAVATGSPAGRSGGPGRVATASTPTATATVVTAAATPAPIRRRRRSRRPRRMMSAMSRPSARSVTRIARRSSSISVTGTSPAVGARTDRRYAASPARGTRCS